MTATAISKLVIGLSAISVLTSCASETRSQQEKAPVSWELKLPAADLPADFAPAEQQRIYVPVYSHIYHEDATTSTALAVTLSLRNTDSETPLILKSIAYYNTEGKLLQEVCKSPVTLGPMATAEIVVPRTNLEGGSGANFLIDWVSKKSVSDPLAEAIMISLGSAQSVSFASRGVPIYTSYSSSSGGAKNPSSGLAATDAEKKELKKTKAAVSSGK